MNANNLVTNDNFDCNSDVSFCPNVNSGKVDSSYSLEATIFKWIMLISSKGYIFILLKTKNEVILQTAAQNTMTCAAN